MPEDEFTPETGDTVEFEAQGQYGRIEGTGTVQTAYKNGTIKVLHGGESYKTNRYTVLSKAG